MYERPVEKLDFFSVRARYMLIYHGGLTASCYIADVSFLVFNACISQRNALSPIRAVHNIVSTGWPQLTAVFLLTAVFAVS